jgi:hypothetical protein
MGVNGESPGGGRGFLIYVFIIADWVNYYGTRMLLILRWMLDLGLDKVFCWEKPKSTSGLGAVEIVRTGSLPHLARRGMISS